MWKGTHNSGAAHLSRPRNPPHRHTPTRWGCTHHRSDTENGCHHMLPELLKCTRAVIRTPGCISRWRREVGLYRQLLTAVVLIGVVHTVWCAVTVPVTWYTPTCPTAELPRFTSYGQYIGSKYIILGPWGTVKYEKTYRNCENHSKKGKGCLRLIKHAVNSTDKPWRQACQPSPPAVTQPSLHSFRACLMFSLSGICGDKVPPLYLPRHSPGEIDSGSIV